MRSWWWKRYMPKWLKEFIAVEATEEAMHEISGAIIAITLVMAAVFHTGGIHVGSYWVYSTGSSRCHVNVYRIVWPGGTHVNAPMCRHAENTHVEKGRDMAEPVSQGSINGSNPFGKYKFILGLIVSGRVVTFLALIGFCAGTWLLNKQLPSGFIPNEDQGMFYAIVQTPPVSRWAYRWSGQAIAEDRAGYGRCEVCFLPWRVLKFYRKVRVPIQEPAGLTWKTGRRKHHVQEIISEFEREGKRIFRVQRWNSLPRRPCQVMAPQAVLNSGCSTKPAAVITKMEAVSNQFVAELNKRRNLLLCSASECQLPQYMLQVDNDMAQQKGDDRKRDEHPVDSRGQ